MKRSGVAGLADIAGQRWRESAGCANSDPRMWDDESDHAATEAAVWRCRGCVVRQDCLRDALANDERHTVRGGLTAKQRAGLALDDEDGAA